jgi:hypothetical protein
MRNGVLRGNVPFRNNFLFFRFGWLFGFWLRESKLF